MKRLCIKLIVLITIVLFFQATACFGYSVLTHEAIIDANWNIVLRSPHQTKISGGHK